MYAIAASSLELDEPRPRARANTVTNTLSWAGGCALLFVGVSGLAMDGTLMLFDTTCIATGLLAMPRLTELARTHLGFTDRGWQHFAAALAVLAGAITLDFTRSGSSWDLYPVNAHPHASSFAAVMPASTPTADDSAAKTAYLAAVVQETKAIAQERALYQSVDAEPTDMDAARLDHSAALLRQRANFTLTAAESAQLDRLGGVLGARRAAMAPALRRNYVEQLSGPLAQYGLTARLIGDDVIEFDGEALADPQNRASILALTQSQRAKLGFRDVRFAAADGPAPTAQIDAAPVG